MLATAIPTLVATPTSAQIATPPSPDRSESRGVHAAPHRRRHHRRQCSCARRGLELVRRDGNGQRLRLRTHAGPARRDVLQSALDVMVEGSQPTILGAPTNAVATGPAGHSAWALVSRREWRYACRRVPQAGLRAIQERRCQGQHGAPRAHRVRGWHGDGADDSTVAWLKRERIAHRVLANFAFSAAQRSYDAVHVARATPRYNVTLMAGMPTEGVFQLDGQGTLTDIHVAYGAITVPARWADFRLFGLRYEDRRPIAKVDNRPAAIRAGDLSAVKVNTIGANLTLAHPIGSAKADLLLWGALQNGDWGAESHLANAFAAEARAAAGAAAQAMAASGILSRTAATIRRERRRAVGTRPSSRCFRPRASTHARRSTT